LTIGGFAQQCHHAIAHGYGGKLVSQQPLTCTGGDYLLGVAPLIGTLRNYQQGHSVGQSAKHRTRPAVSDDGVTPRQKFMLRDQVDSAKAISA